MRTSQVEVLSGLEPPIQHMLPSSFNLILQNLCNAGQHRGFLLCSDMTPQAVAAVLFQLVPRSQSLSIAVIACRSLIRLVLILKRLFNTMRLIWGRLARQVLLRLASFSMFRMFCPFCPSRLIHLGPAQNSLHPSPPTIIACDLSSIFPSFVVQASLASATFCTPNLFAQNATTA
jgi:hypothetical protein